MAAKMADLPILPVALMLLVGSLGNAAEKQEFRTWTDIKGRKLEAAMVDVRDGNVLLKLSDGKVYPWPIEKLSKADQDYVKEVQVPIDEFEKVTSCAVFLEKVPREP